MTLTNAYCTLADLKDVLGKISDTADDAALERAINAASRQIDGFCKQRFWKDSSAVARTFFVTGDGASLGLGQSRVAGLADASGVVVKTDTAGNGTYATTLVVGTDFLLLPTNAAADGLPFTSIELGLSGATWSSLPLTPSGRPLVQVTGKWGWPAVPDDVVQACLLQAEQLWKAKDAVFGVASFGDAGQLRVNAALNPIAEGLLDPYRFVTLSAA